MPPPHNPVYDAIYWLASKEISFKIKSTICEEDLDSYIFNTYTNFYKIHCDLLDKYNAYIMYRLNIDHFHRTIVNYEKLDEQFYKILDFLKRNRIKETGWNWFDKILKQPCNKDSFALTINHNGELHLCNACAFTDSKKFTPVSLLKEDNIENIFYTFENFASTMSTLNKECNKCKNCNASMCNRCSLLIAINNNYDLDKWNDHHKPEICKLYKHISGFVRSHHRQKDQY